MPRDAARAGQPGGQLVGGDVPGGHHRRELAGELRRQRAGEVADNGVHLRAVGRAGVGGGAIDLLDRVVRIVGDRGDLLHNQIGAQEDVPDTGLCQPQRARADDIRAAVGDGDRSRSVPCSHDYLLFIIF